MPEDPRIESYVTALSAHLGAMDEPRRQALAAEFAARIAAEAAEPGRSVEDVLAGLGPAEKLAVRYRRATVIQRARRSYSPVTLLNASLNANFLEYTKILTNKEIQVEYAKKWSGAVPTTILPGQGSGMLLDLRK